MNGVKIDIKQTPIVVPNDNMALVYHKLNNELIPWGEEDSLLNIERVEYFARKVCLGAWIEPKIYFVKQDELGIFNEMLFLNEREIEGIVYKRVEIQHKMWVNTQRYLPWWRRVWRAFKKEY